ncbi:MAG: hypothetical protein Ct9H300mP5_3180 [Candidatus Pelagibacterales bacterium]|nr:MAG: hypothetical protein Ct9H300mP5_3180 [Pelagibacterales bacterium]
METGFLIGGAEGTRTDFKHQASLLWRSNFAEVLERTAGTGTTCEAGSFDVKRKIKYRAGTSIR